MSCVTVFSARFAGWKRCQKAPTSVSSVSKDTTCSWKDGRTGKRQRDAPHKHVNICKVWKTGLTLGRAGAGRSRQSSTKKLICFYGGAESLPPHLHLVALCSGRRGDTPPVGRQDALLKATGGHTPDQGTHRHRACSFPRRRRPGVRSDRSAL